MSEREIRVVVDHREPEKVVYALRGMGMTVETATLGVADYVLSSECAIERKTTHDFAESIFDGRLFQQAQSLKDAYRNPLLILEGSLELESVLADNPRALWGAMLRLELDAGLPIFPSPSFQATADIIYTLAKRPREGRAGQIRVQYKPRLPSREDRQTYVVASLPGVGDKLAKRLLARFGSVRNVMCADKEQLAEVDGIGASKAAKIAEILDYGADG